MTNMWGFDTGSIETVSCGSHKADTCLACPEGKGKDWCNGDCQWDSESDTCIPRPIKPVSCGSHKADTCLACPQGNGKDWCNGDCQWDNESDTCIPGPKYVTPEYEELLDLNLYPFQPVRDENGKFVNVMLVQSAFSHPEEKAAFEKYKDDILFLGIMSYETFPFPSPNPHANKFGRDDYLDIFPGWLNMYRNPEEIFPDNVKILQMSQSDFALPEIDYEVEVKEGKHIKRFDFVYVMSTGGTKVNEDYDGACNGWGAHAKNFTFAKDALEVMCDEGMTGVVLATRDDWTSKPCKLPASCEGKVLQTPYVSYEEALDYFRQSKFLFIPQVYDASPRVVTQAMALDVPVLMNRNIVGGWKYINDKTGEFFNDLSDFKESYAHVLANGNDYEPRRYVIENYGTETSGEKLFRFVKEHFSDRVNLPEGSKVLVPS